MKYEVEQKFPIPDIAVVQSRLATLGETISAARLEVDVYYARPARDFTQPDEALRIRRVGESNCMTNKGPKIDSTTKTRHEIELPLAPGDESGRRCGELLESLGFRPIGEVRKQRRKATVIWQDRQVSAVLDDVEGLGLFAELELLCEPAEVEASKACIASLAQRLELQASERRGYIEMLLE
jgi:adenylate cyclase class 2